MAELNEDARRRLGALMGTFFQGDAPIKVQLHTEPPDTGEHGFAMRGPTVTRHTFWDSDVGGRQLSREEVERILGKERVAELLGETLRADRCR
jgi:hypothetical protein